MEMNAEGVGEVTEENREKAGNVSGGEEGATNAAPKSGRERSLANLTPNGRPKGVKNKNTDLKNAVLKAFDKVGGAKYLVQMANGTASDRAAFMNLVGKVMPKEVSGTINHNVIPQLPWLQARHVDKSDPADYQSVSTAGKALSDQRVVEGEVIQQADGLPLNNPEGTDGGSHD